MKKNLLRGLFMLLACSLFTDAVFSATIMTSAVPVNASNPLTNEVPMPSVKDMVRSFKSMPRAERKSRFKQVKQELKKFKQEKKAGAEPIANRTLIIILAILIPPLGVYLHEGEINSKFWISLLLTLLFFIPGMIYALLVVFDEI